jgi:type IV secretory pathway VirB6-like protein
MLNYIKSKIAIYQTLFIVFLLVITGCSNNNLNSDFDDNNSCITPPIKTSSGMSDNLPGEYYNFTVAGNDNNWQATNYQSNSDVASISFSIDGSINVAQSFGVESDVNSGCYSQDDSYEHVKKNNPQIQNFLCSCIPDRTYTTVNPFAHKIQGEINTTLDTTFYRDYIKKDFPNNQCYFQNHTNHTNDTKHGNRCIKYTLTDNISWFGSNDGASDFSCQDEGENSVGEPPVYFGYCCNNMPDDISNLNASNLENNLVPEYMYKNANNTPNNLWYSCPMLSRDYSSDTTNSQSNISYDGNNNTLYNGRGIAVYVPADGANSKDKIKNNIHGKTVRLFENINACNYNIDWGNILSITVANPMDDFNVALSANIPSSGQNPEYAFLSRWTWNGAFSLYWGGETGNGAMLIYKGTPTDFTPVPYSNPIDDHYCMFNPDCSTGTEMSDGQIAVRDCIDRRKNRGSSHDNDDFQTNGEFGSCWNVNGRGLTVSFDDKKYYSLDYKLNNGSIWSHKGAKRTFFINSKLPSIQNEQGENYFIANYNSCASGNNNPGCDETAVTIQDHIYSTFVNSKKETDSFSLNFRIYNTQLNPLYTSNNQLVGFIPPSSNYGGATPIGGTNAASYYPDNNMSYYPTNDKNLEQVITNNKDNIFPMVGGYTIFVKAEPYSFPNENKNYNLYGCFAKEGVKPDISNTSNSQQFSTKYTDASGNIQTLDFEVTGCDTTAFEITNNTSLPNIPENSKLYLLFFDPGSYANNSGNYSVTLNVSSKADKNNILSDIIAGILSPFEFIIKSASTAVVDFADCGYTSGGTATCSVSYGQIIMIILTLYIIIYAICFTFGVVQISQADLILRVMKIAIIIGIFNPNFFRYLTQDVLQSAHQMGYNLTMLVLKVTTNNEYQTITSLTNLAKTYFSMFDHTIGVIIADPQLLILQLVAILLSGLSGLIVFILLAIAIYCLMSSLFAMIQIFALSFFFVSILIILTPIFLPFILFEQTKYLTDKWFKLLIRYSLEPMLIFVGAFIINSMMIIPIVSIFDFSVCYKCAVPLFGLGFLKQFLGNIISSNEILLCIPAYLPWGLDNLDGGLPLFSTSFRKNAIIDLNNIIVFVILASLMRYYIKFFGSQIANWLTSTMGLTVSLTDAVGKDNLEGRNRGGSGSGDGFPGEELFDMFRGKGFGNGFIARTLGISSSQQYERKAALNQSENDELDLAMEKANNIHKFTDPKDLQNHLDIYNGHVKKIHDMKKELSTHNEAYKKAVKSGNRSLQQSSATKIHQVERELLSYIQPKKDEIEKISKILTSKTNADLIRKNALRIKMKLQESAGETVTIAKPYQGIRELATELDEYNKSMLDNLGYGSQNQAGYNVYNDLTIDLASNPDQQVSETADLVLGNLTFKRALAAPDNDLLIGENPTDPARKTEAVRLASDTLTKLDRLSKSTNVIAENSVELARDMKINLEDYSLEERTKTIRERIEQSKQRLKAYIDTNK